MPAAPLLLERCPACRLRLPADDTPDDPCPRCRADLSALRKTHLAASCWREAALAALQAGQRAAALYAAAQALALLDAPITRDTLKAAHSAPPD